MKELPDGQEVDISKISHFTLTMPEGRAVIEFKFVDGSSCIFKSKFALMDEANRWISDFCNDKDYLHRVDDINNLRENENEKD